jgi:hypothetical protein
MKGSFNKGKTLIYWGTVNFAMEDWNKINIALYITHCDEKKFPLREIDGRNDAGVNCGVQAPNLF